MLATKSNGNGNHPTLNSGLTRVGLHGNNNGHHPGVLAPLPDDTSPSIVEVDNWPGIKNTEIGCLFTTEVTRDTWKAFGAWAGQINRMSKLWIADWVTYGFDQGWANTYDELEEITGLEYETLRNYASIGYRVPIRNRILGEKNSHYAAVACLHPRDQLALLKRAKKNKWTRDILRAEVKAFKAGQPPLGDDGARFPEDTLPDNAAVPVKRTERHHDAYKLALLRDTTDLAALFEVGKFKPNMEIEMTITGNLADLMALLAAELPDEMEVDLKVWEVGKA